MDKAQQVYWEVLAHPIFGDKPIYLAATDKGLCLITLPHESFETMQRWVGHHLPHAMLVRDRVRMAHYSRELTAYLDGARQTFTLALDLIGTPFQRAVWQALTKIGYGQVMSYSEIAEAIHNPGAVRAVGAANGKNPLPFVVPCHRVIGKGKTLTGYRGGLHVKETLLKLEGFTGYTAKGHARFQF